MGYRSFITNSIKIGNKMTVGLFTHLVWMLTDMEGILGFLFSDYWEYQNRCENNNVIHNCLTICSAGR